MQAKQAPAIALQCNSFIVETEFTRTAITDKYLHVSISICTIIKSAREMNLKIYTPSLQLQSYIKCYYLSQSHYTEYIKDVFFPDGCVEVVFQAGLDFYRDEEKECWAKVIGQITRPLTRKAIGKGKSFGIWFLPHTFCLFSEIALNELNDKVISLDIIFSQGFIDFVKNCLFENDINRLVEGTNKTWLSFDGVNPDTLQVNADYLKTMKENDLLDQVLVSQDSGWYNVGEPKGGHFKPYTCIPSKFIPLLQQNGFTARELDRIFRINPAKAFTIKVRKY